MYLQVNVGTQRKVYGWGDNVVLLVAVCLKRLVFSKQGLRTPPHSFYAQDNHGFMKKSNLFVLQIGLKDKENCYPFHDSKCILQVLKHKNHPLLLRFAFCFLTDCPRDLESVIRFLGKCMASWVTHEKTVGHRPLTTLDPSS